MERNGEGLVKVEVGKKRGESDVEIYRRLEVVVFGGRMSGRGNKRILKDIVWIFGFGYLGIGWYYC